MNKPVDLNEAKRLLREEVLATRKSLSVTERTEQSAAIVEKLKKLPELAFAEMIAGYAPSTDEVNIADSLIFWTSIGRSVVLPRVDPVSGKLHWHNIYDWKADLTTGYRGIREPSLTTSEINPSQIRVALIPAIAVDKQGNRLGFGGGFYDRNIPNLTTSILIVPVFPCQLLHHVPIDDFDQKIHIIVTSSAVIRCSQ